MDRTGDGSSRSTPVVALFLGKDSCVASEEVGISEVRAFVPHFCRGSMHRCISPLLKWVFFDSLWNLRCTNLRRVFARLAISIECVSCILKITLLMHCCILW